jgi:uncharacterized membrane protein
MKKFHSDISNNEFPISVRVSGKMVSPSILNLILKDNPKFTIDKFLSISELDTYREKYISDYLIKESGDLTESEKTMLTSVNDKTTLISKIASPDDEQSLTAGQRVADKVASFGGSWKFLILFGLFLIIWISLNIFWLANKGYDPYPFILLNLILSCLAAIQAPVIMMSQNRQEEKDRVRAKIDYMINLKSELEIRMLHEKLDHLIINQQQELIELQKVQIDMMNNILKQIEK